MEKTGGFLGSPRISIYICFEWGKKYDKEEHGNKAVRNLNHIVRPHGYQARRTLKKNRNWSLTGFCRDQNRKAESIPCGFSDQDRLLPTAVLIFTEVFSTPHVCFFVFIYFSGGRPTPSLYSYLLLTYNLVYAKYDLLMVAHGLCLHQFLLLTSMKIFSLENLIIQIPNRENIIGPGHHYCLSWERTLEVRRPHRLVVVSYPTMRGRVFHWKQPMTMQLCT